MQETLFIKEESFSNDICIQCGVKKKKKLLITITTRGGMEMEEKCDIESHFCSSAVGKHIGHSVISQRRPFILS